MPMRKLGKPTDQRMAMLRQLTTDLLEKGKLETTVTELSPDRAGAAVAGSRMCQ